MHVYKPPPVGGLDRVPVFTAGTGTTRADLFELDGVTPMPGNVLVADTGGNLPSFQCAMAPVFVGPSGSRTTWTPSESGAPSSAASGAMSSTKIAQVSGPQPLTPQTATHGTFTDVDFTGSTIVKGAAYWGVPDSALDLDVTIVGGTVRPPQADCQYDIWANVIIACDLADAGKLVGLLLQGNNQIGRSWAPVRSSDGIVLLAAEITDQVFVGDQANIGFAVDAQELTVDASVSSAVMFLVQR